MNHDQEKWKLLIHKNWNDLKRNVEKLNSILLLLLLLLCIEYIFYKNIIGSTKSSIYKVKLFGTVFQPYWRRLQINGQKCRNTLYVYVTTDRNLLKRVEYYYVSQCSQIVCCNNNSIWKCAKKTYFPVVATTKNKLREKWIQKKNAEFSIHSKPYASLCNQFFPEFFYFLK